MTTTTEKVHFWTYIRDEEIFDADFNSKQEASDYAQTRYNEERSDADDFKDSSEEEIELIRYHYDDDGERVIVERAKDTLEYEYYHGDMAEHGTWHSGGGGVL